MNVAHENSRSWIVDYGVSNHMTREASMFTLYSPCTTNLTIRIADRSLSKMASTIIVRISKDIHLDPVLFVPNLDCNLLSISKLTRDLKNVTKFFSLSCEFQNLDSKRMIGNTKMCARLYSFRANDPVKQS